MEAIADLYRRAARCRVCFVDKTGLKAPIIDVAQPRWVGTRYRDARPRIVFLMLNPGAGDPSKEAGNRAARQVLLGFRDGGATFADVLAFQRQHMESWAWEPTWKKAEPRVMFGRCSQITYCSVPTRRILCFWAVRELGISQVQLARMLRVTQPAVSMAVSRGEQLAIDHNFSIMNE